MGRARAVAPALGSSERPSPRSCLHPEGALCALSKQCTGLQDLALWVHGLVGWPSALHDCRREARGRIPVALGTGCCGIVCEWSYSWSRSHPWPCSLGRPPGHWGCVLPVTTLGCVWQQLA